MNRNQLQKKLLETFKIEAGEHLRAISSNLLTLEKNLPEDKKRIIAEAIHREAHSLKGASRSVDLVKIEQLCQAMERVFSAWKRTELKFTREQFDVLHQAVHILETLLTADDILSESQNNHLLTEYTIKISKLAQDKSSLKSALEIEKIDPGILAVPHNDIILSDTVRISTSKLDSLLLKAEEMLTVKLTMQEFISELRKLTDHISAWKKEYEASLLLEQRNSAEFLKNTNNQIKFIEHSLLNQISHLENGNRHFNGLVDSLLEDTKKIIMLPFSTLLDCFPPMVRNLGRDVGKEIDFAIEGDEIEIDKRILDDLKDPLIHLIRNSIDHGIEKPEERVKQQKPPQGLITILVSQVSVNEVKLAISDDGRGIDFDAVKKSAMKEGYLSQNAAQEIDDRTAISYIYHSGVSTSPIITDISGNGIGMAIVRDKVEKLDGKIELETEINQGTRITLSLPLTLAKFKGIAIKVADQPFVLPTAHLEYVVRIQPDDIRTIENKKTIVHNNISLAFIRLHDILEIPYPQENRDEKKFLPVVIINYNNVRLAFQVDEIQNEHEVLVKKLGLPIIRARNIAGATILGNGDPVPILSTSDLMKSAINNSFQRQPTETIRPAINEKNQSILVVDDSITTRMLIKNILEIAGYAVRTAVDGIDAWQILRENDIALVVSDVEMPRLNGFELACKIRSDANLAELPIILVTGRESQADRARGMEVGANAYIVKSGFHDTNLIAVVKRLI